MTTNMNPADNSSAGLSSEQRSAAENQSFDLERGPADFGDTRKSAPRGARAFLWITGLLATAITLGFMYHRYGPSEEACVMSPA